MSAPFPLTGKVRMMLEHDIDTDIIYPARFLLQTGKLDLGQYAFADRRDDNDFPLPLDESISILVAGNNFGCGSSREHAVWALHSFGIRTIIAPSFGEIFYSNCTRNGIVPIKLPHDLVEMLAGQKDETLTIDLKACEIRGNDFDAIAFDISAGHREALLNDWDETSRVLALFSDKIDAYEHRKREAGMWY